MVHRFKEILPGNGEITWYQKVDKWIFKQNNPYLRHLYKGLLEWVKKWWFKLKVDNTMRDVDRQAKKIVEEWEEEEINQFAPEIKVEPSEVKGLDNISISFKSREWTEEDEIRELDDYER